MNDVAELVFTKLYKSFQVDIINLESLTVQAIQKLEQFVKSRNGIFDFELYRFVIQKNIEFYEFETLLKYTNIKCSCTEKINHQTQSPRIEFGQYRGMFFVDLDDAYIVWLKSNYRGPHKKFIDDEVKKRKL